MARLPRVLRMACDEKAVDVSSPTPRAQVPAETAGWLALPLPGLLRSQLGSLKFRTVWDSLSPRTHLTLLVPAEAWLEETQSRVLQNEGAAPGPRLASLLLLLRKLNTCARSRKMLLCSAGPLLNPLDRFPGQRGRTCRQGFLETSTPGLPARRSLGGCLSPGSFGDFPQGVERLRPTHRLGRLVGAGVGAGAEKRGRADTSLPAGSPRMLSGHAPSGTGVLVQQLSTAPTRTHQ